MLLWWSSLNLSHNHWNGTYFVRRSCIHLIRLRLMTLYVDSPMSLPEKQILDDYRCHTNVLRVVNLDFSLNSLALHGNYLLVTHLVAGRDRSNRQPETSGSGPNRNRTSFRSVASPSFSKRDQCDFVGRSRTGVAGCSSHRQYKQWRWKLTASPNRLSAQLL